MLKNKSVECVLSYCKEWIKSGNNFIFPEDKEAVQILFDAVTELKKKIVEYKEECKRKRKINISLNNIIKQIKKEFKEAEADRKFLSILLRDSKHNMLINLDPELSKAIIKWAKGE